MKRKYVKPVMECEAFVANEYVATCYQVYCKGYNSTLPWNPDHSKHEFIGEVVRDKNSIQLHEKGSVTGLNKQPAYTYNDIEHFAVEIRDGAHGANHSA